MAKKPTQEAGAVSESSKKEMMRTQHIYPCTCNHEYQDSINGKGRRLFTYGSKGMTCTVCGSKR